jgi:Na+-transporting NADH:ubiquinone oxidoreductase subunit F
MIQTYSAILTRKSLVTPDIYILTLDLINQELEFTAGQYIILKVPQQDGEFARRLYSISSPPSAKGNLELVLKRIPGGVATTYIDGIQIGTEITFDAPAGVFTMKSEPGRSVIMLEANTGITPFRSMILDEMNKGPLKRDIRVFWGMRHFADLYYHDEFVHMTKTNDRFYYTVCLSRDKKPYESVLNQRVDRVLVENVLPAFASSRHDYYICGGSGVIDTLRGILLENGIAKQHIFFERFT